MKGTRINIIGRGNTITISQGTFLSGCSINISGNNNKISIGQDCRLYDFHPTIEDNNGTIQIGDRVEIDGYTHLACIEGGTIDIASDCLFSSDITVRTGDSHSILDSLGNRINPSEDVKIGNHVWVGNKVIILKGAVISTNSIIGSGAVVTRGYYSPNSIIAGNPAREVKHGINWKKDRIGGSSKKAG